MSFFLRQLDPSDPPSRNRVKQTPSCLSFLSFIKFKKKYINDSLLRYLNKFLHVSACIIVFFYVIYSFYIQVLISLLGCLHFYYNKFICFQNLELFSPLDSIEGKVGIALPTRKKIFEKNLFWKKRLKIFLKFFLAFVTPRLPMSFHTKVQSIRSSRLAGYRGHITQCLVYR